MTNNDFVDLIRDIMREEMRKIHTAIPATIKSYNADERRAEVQPSVQVKMLDGTFSDMPVIVDVPVLFFGNKKGGVHIDLDNGDEVLLIFCERCIDSWKDSGGDGVREEDTRRFSISDAVAVAGLQAADFADFEEKDGLAFQHDEKISFASGKNKIVISADDGMSAEDKNGNKIKMTKDGMTLEDKNGCTIEMTSSGVKINGKLEIKK